jgi:hypothetical protein
VYCIVHVPYHIVPVSLWIVHVFYSIVLASYRKWNVLCIYRIVLCVYRIVLCNIEYYRDKTFNVIKKSTCVLSFQNCFGFALENISRRKTIHLDENVTLVNTRLLFIQQGWEFRTLFVIFSFCLGVMKLIILRYFHLYILYRCYEIDHCSLSSPFYCTLYRVTRSISVLRLHLYILCKSYEIDHCLLSSPM